MTDQPPTAPATPQPKSETPEQLQQKQLQAFLRAPVQRLYANGIGTATTAADVSVILLMHGAPTAIVSMSYTTAKSLVNDVGNAIKNFEDKTDEKIKGIKELQAKLTAKSSR